VGEDDVDGGQQVRRGGGVVELELAVRGLTTTAGSGTKARFIVSDNSGTSVTVAGSTTEVPPVSRTG
jgi:hypothetical protein